MSFSLSHRFEFKLELVVRCPECNSKDLGYVQLEHAVNRTYCRTCGFVAYDKEGNRYYLSEGLQTWESLRKEGPNRTTRPMKSSKKRTWVYDK